MQAIRSDYQASPCTTIGLPGETPLLVAAHPGHELRIHQWLETAHPTVFILTDGSGSAGEGRIGSTSQVLRRTGARPGAVYGLTTDRGIYGAILDRDFALFARTVDAIAGHLVRDGVDYIVGDAVEGYNPSHDACRLMVNAAVEMVRRTSGRKLPNYDFLLVGAPDDCPEELVGDAVWLRLGDEDLARKLEAARQYPELAAEVERLLARFGPAAFGTECLRPVGDGLSVDLDDPPYYETYGEQRVAAGAYQRVLRYREHFLPLAEALGNHVERTA
jgi:hypothetical protein